MLTINYEQHSGSDKDSATQAKAVVAALVAMHGVGILPDAIRVTGSANFDLPSTRPLTVEITGSVGGAGGAAALAVDGEPMSDAATAFGGTPSVVPTTSTSLVPPPPAGPEEDEGTPATGDRDKNGLPWDERIHSETRNLNKDGTWRNRRNLDKDVLATVTAELNAANTARTLDAATGLVPTPPSAVPPPPTAAPAVPVPPAATPTAAGPLTFPGTMKRITELQAAKKIDAATVKGLYSSLGVTSITGLMNNQDLIDAMNAMLDAHA